MAIEVVPVPYGDKEVLRRLIEFYDYDFSEYLGWDVNDHGAFGYRYLDHYWIEADRHPFFIDVDGRLAGFSLVCSGRPNDMAEFFVMRKYRRAGVGREAARQVFEQFPGTWQVRELEANVGGSSFWRSVIPVPFEERRWEDGPMQVFTVG
jgi:predicted acetyltransferase